MNVTDEDIKRIFEAHGISVLDDNDNVKLYVIEAARALIEFDRNQDSYH